jgi:hypothetical protein
MGTGSTLGLIRACFRALRSVTGFLQHTASDTIHVLFTNNGNILLLTLWSSGFTYCIVLEVDTNILEEKKILMHEKCLNHWILGARVLFLKFSFKDNFNFKNNKIITCLTKNDISITENDPQALILQPRLFKKCAKCLDNATGIPSIRLLSSQDTSFIKNQQSNLLNAMLTLMFPIWDLEG